MSGRVSIPQLRETCEVIWEADGSEAHGTVARADVLALLDAVEAAHALDASLDDLGSAQFNHDGGADVFGKAWSALEDVLARFDFSDGDA